MTMKSRVGRIGLILIGLVLASRSFAEIDPKTAVGAWLFDEGAGKEVTDLSNMGLTGTFTGSPKWVDGKFGKALEFDGKSYVTIPDHENPSTAITVSAWVKSPSPAWNQHGFIVEKRDAFILHPVQGGIAVAWCFCNPGCWNQPQAWDSGAKGPADGDITAWHMYTGTFDSKTGKWFLYVDGAVVSTLDLNKSAITVEKGPIHIGYDECCGGRWGVATIDEVLIFSVALGADDLKTLVDGGYTQALAVQPKGKLASTWAGLKEKSH